MKKVRIASIVCMGLALILEILPFSLIVKIDGFYQEASFHSYFDINIFADGNIGPFICGIITVAVFIMVLISFFVKVKDIYQLSVAFITLANVVLSLIPTLNGQYSIFGVAITVLLSIATELCFMQFVNRKK